MLAYAWLLGPPAPVYNTPCASNCCGVTAHLLGVLLTDAVIPSGTDLARKLLA